MDEARTSTLALGGLNCIALEYLLGAGPMTAADTCEAQGHARFKIAVIDAPAP